MVYRVYVERKPGFESEAASLQHELQSVLGIKNLEKLRLLNRYDVEGISEELFTSCLKTVFSEPQTDDISPEFDAEGGYVFAVEYLPGQFDQRADSAAQCIQILAQVDRPVIRSARVYILYGALTEADKAAIQKHVINPVESRLARLETYETLRTDYALPESVATLTGFTALEEDGLKAFLKEWGLAMDLGDVTFCRDYFRKEGRDPTLTEIRVLDTYWSDHCRHTTFNTILDNVTFEDEAIRATWEEYLRTREELGRSHKPICLMDVGTIAGKALKAQGKLDKLDESDEINACTVKITITVDGKEEDWLLLFKNETHNHPTEIEPFGGAATCIGGAIRDPLSGRSYVYAAMRVTGAADPTVPVSETIPGKLPQRTIVTKAAAGYSSYGNQIGLCTGIVDEVYHPGYAAKRMEIGAVIGAVPADAVRREEPTAGDLIILLGGRTGRDGCGGATGSSKSHTTESLESCGAEVQKGNAPEERKLQRLFRNKEATLLIKRCNDFGAGGVSVAIGEIASGLDIDLNAVPRKYDGLDGTELAISESQERMAVAVAAEDAARFMELARKENLESTIVAKVTDSGRLVMRWNGKVIVDIARSFLDTNGAEKHTDAAVAAPETYEPEIPECFACGMTALAMDLNVCSKRGLSERFDSTIGAGSVLMPFGGSTQRTPIQAMVHRISVEKGHTDDCSVMSWGYNPLLMEKSPYHGAYLAVVESLCKLAAAGSPMEEVYMSFQEYFERMKNPGTWGKPLAALLGAFRAQMDYGVAAIGGKDSMSGSFEQLHVPPTLTSFAVSMAKLDDILTPEFKAASHRVAWLKPELGEDGLPTVESVKALWKTVYETKPYACYTPTYGGVAEAVLKMCLGNDLGFAFAEGITTADIFAPNYGSFILETDSDVGITLGYVTDDGCLTMGEDKVDLAALAELYENRLSGVYPTDAGQGEGTYEPFTHKADTWAAPAIKVAKPRVLIPVFPGTNCEYDTAKVMRDAGAEPEIFVMNNLTAASVSESVEAFAAKLKESQIVFIPGGFSGGDEPDGSGKFITAFFRSPAVRDGVHELLKNRDGLMCGICNGFQALIKLGLVPYGEIREMDEECPTLTFNAIGRHQSRLVRTRVASNKSPWLMETQPGEIYTVPISHGEGRFVANPELVAQLAANGQIATQYVNADGVPTADILFNPNDSVCAIEGITSPDGRVLGKMGHTERAVDGLYKNVPGVYDMGIFRSAVKYFK